MKSRRSKSQSRLQDDYEPPKQIQAKQIQTEARFSPLIAHKRKTALPFSAFFSFYLFCQICDQNAARLYLTREKHIIHGLNLVDNTRQTLSHFTRHSSAAYDDSFGLLSKFCDFGYRPQWFRHVDAGQIQCVPLNGKRSKHSTVNILHSGIRLKKRAAIRSVEHVVLITHYFIYVFVIVS